MALRNFDLLNIWSVEQMTVQNYGICSKFGKVTVENLTFCNLGFGKNVAPIFCRNCFQNNIIEPRSQSYDFKIFHHNSRGELFKAKLAPTENFAPCQHWVSG
jgi:hypothetical protein